MLLTDGITQLLMAGVLGSLITFGVVGWLIGDVRALSWQWGSIGEQQTADLLNELEDSWRAENDLPARRGNWDHVLTGPAGVFLIETKFLLSGNPVRVEGDEVVAGRARHPVGWLRGAAASLKQELERRTGRRHWVQAVVVIWGDFQARRLEGDRVMYLHANELLPWLREQPPTLDDESGLELQKAVAALRDEPIGPGRS